MQTLNKTEKTFSIVYSEKTCRICLKHGDIPIFDDKNCIDKDITELTGIYIADYDELPKYICNMCYTMFQSAVLFRNTAKETDMILKKLRVKIEEDNSGSDKFDQLSTGEPFVKREYLEVNNATEDSEIESDGQTNSLFKVQKSSSETDDGEHLSEYLDVDTDELMDIQNRPSEFVSNSNTTSTSPKHGFHEQDENTITCEVCDEVVSKGFYEVHLKLHRAAHKQRVQKLKKKVECELCLKMITKAYYSYHKIVAHGDDIAKAKIMCECPFCGKSFYKRNLANHIEHKHADAVQKQSKHQNKQTQQCPVCDKIVKEENYKEHVARHGKRARVYICDQCGKKCASRSSLSLHKMSHGSELKHKCVFCPYRGSHLNLLKVHVRTHTKDYNYKCTLCSAKFITKSNLSIHMQRHTGIGKFKCEQCDKTFFLKRNRENHFKTAHGTERNHRCDVCGKTYANRDALVSHQHRTHKKARTNHKGRLPNYLVHELSNPQKEV